jgi:hypothetical protein
MSVNLDELADAEATKKPARRRKKDDFGAKVEVHQRYYTSTGQMVPGSTTILGVVGKPHLVRWANNLGLEGIDSDKYRDEAAATGSALHYLVECYLLDREPDVSDITPAQLERAQLGLTAFKQWRDDEAPDLQPLGIEIRLVSDEYRFGGTIDLYALIRGRYTLVDYKTAASVYIEHKAQVTSYVRLAQESGLRVQDAVIIQLPRVEDAPYVAHKLIPAHMTLYWRLFRWAHEGYDLNKTLKKAGA